MITCKCLVDGCFFVAHYQSHTLQQIKDSPPMSSIPLEPGEHAHQWEIYNE
jgi:hypothetical protein